MTSQARTDIRTLQWLSDEYYDLNGSYHETLDQPPSALMFSRLVHISRPVVIKGFDIPALHRWSDEYLIEKMGDEKISVAVTPNGRADAVTPGPSDKLYFIEPHTQKMTMHEFLSNLGNKTDDPSNNNQETLYLQSQNGNMYSAPYFKNDTPQEHNASEFEALRSDVPSEILWCSKAFGRPPDAVNIWIGDKNSVTSIHNDPYENIYTVIRGTKHFTLLPPTEGWCLQERTYPHATYTRDIPTSPLRISPSKDSLPIRWSSISNPHLPNTLPPGAHPIRISLKAGETLYLPAGWWHHVRQGEDANYEKEILEETTLKETDKTIAINWWYDIEGRGMGWVWLRFLRGEEVPDGN